MANKDTIGAKDLLVAMLESHDVTSEYNNKLHTKQIQLLDEQNKASDNMLQILDKQKEINIQLESLIKSLTNHDLTCGTNASEIAKDIKEDLINNVKEHNRLKLHMVGVSSGLIVIIISLITTISIIWSKVDIIDAVAKHLGIG